jgi:hypothetical protein
MVAIADALSQVLGRVMKDGGVRSAALPIALRAIYRLPPDIVGEAVSLKTERHFREVLSPRLPFVLGKIYGSKAMSQMVALGVLNCLET